MTPYYEQDGITIYHGDCRDVLNEWEGLRTQLFDLLLTDPPYGIFGHDSVGRHDVANGWRQYGVATWDREAIDCETLARCRGVCRSSVIWGGNYFDLPVSMGWLVWNKGQREFSLADGELAWTSEQRALRIFDCSRAQALQDGKVHPTQKPEALMSWVLSLFPSAQTIFDPFMGSGTTLIAAKRLGKQAVGIEREERYCEIAAKRLSQGVLPLTVEPEAARQLALINGG